MYKLFQFLFKIRIFLFFIILELFNILQIYRRNDFQKAIYFNTANEWIYHWTQQVDQFKNYLNLGNQNDLLVKENARLKQLLFNRNIHPDQIDSVLQQSVPKEHLTYFVLTAKVVYNSVNSSKNFLAIDKGRADGVENGMGVISSNGIVGKVVKTLDHHSLVLSVLNTENSISAKIKSNNELGYIKWDGNLPEIVDLNDISKFKRVEIGDSIVTSDYNTIFPPNILIGIVAEKGLKEDGNYQDIKVLLSNQFNKLKYVYLIKNRNKIEIDSLVNDINTIKEDE